MAVFTVLFVLPLLCDFAVAEHLAEKSEHVVSVKQGDLQGTTLKSRSSRTIYAFRGIPYAKPPIGELRFKSPQDADSWEGIRDASQHGSACIQQDMFLPENRLVEGSEDCLFLDVYTHQINRKAEDDVMVWFHGGGWMSGSGSQFGPKYLLDRDVVLVTVNYRLGPLGFLSTGDAASSGNYGLKDQVQALKWVQQNIAVFGGNPGSVTLFGQSAGGASAHYHMLSPMSQGLFHRAISQSGTAIDVWALSRNPHSNAVRLAELLDCSTESSQILVDCLRTREATDIVSAQDKFPDWGNDPMFAFCPVVELDGDDIFLPGNPHRLLQEGKFQKVPWIVGATAQDGALKVAAIAGNSSLFEDLQNDFNRVAPITLNFQEHEQKAEVSQEIFRFYFGYGSLTNETLHFLTELYSDRYTYLGMDRAVRLHASSNEAPVYVYQFVFRGNHSFTDLMGVHGENYGVSHGDDLQYLFTCPRFFPDFEDEDSDLKIVDTMVSLWTNFAKLGNPTPELTELLNVTWTPVPQSEEGYMTHLKIGSMLQNASYLHGAGVGFWETLPVQLHWEEIQVPDTAQREEL